MTETPSTAELRIRTDPAQMEGVITQIGKVGEMMHIPGDTLAYERLFTITPRQPPQMLPPISVVFFAADDDSPVTPNKLRSLFCNPAYLRLEPYSAGLVDDELWVSPASAGAHQ
jgi:hypothetical protein